MTGKLKLVAISGIFVLATVYLSPWFMTPSNQTLLKNALTSPEQKTRIKAAQSLCERNRKALSEIQQLAKTSRDDDVVALCLLAMSRNYYFEGIEDAFSLLESPSVAIQKSAAKSIATYLGVDHHFPVGGKEDEKNKVASAMRSEWERYQRSKLFQVNRERFSKESE